MEKQQKLKIKVRLSDWVLKMTFIVFLEHEMEHIFQTNSDI